jgi:hypothetical protein
MGRLTLNVLLSFAQFEREVTAERIRDKIAASKKKGMWMGGTVPWGYQVHSDPKVQSLEPHPQNAPDIQRVFDLYERVGCLSKLKREVDQLWPNRSYSRGRLHNILRNPIYIGKVRHKTEVYEGLHEAIVAQDQFDRVQGQMQLKSVINQAIQNTPHSLFVYPPVGMERGRSDRKDASQRLGHFGSFWVVGLIAECFGFGSLPNQKRICSVTQW